MFPLLSVNTVEAVQVGAAWQPTKFSNFWVEYLVAPPRINLCASLAVFRPPLFSARRPGFLVLANRTLPSCVIPSAMVSTVEKRPAGLCLRQLASTCILFWCLLSPRRQLIAAALDPQLAAWPDGEVDS